MPSGAGPLNWTKVSPIRWNRIQQYELAGQRPGLSNVIERATILSTIASTSPQTDTKV
jgi:hypothetical protein